MKNRKREICTSGTVRDEGGNILIYSANTFDFDGSLRFTEHRETQGEAYYRKACRNRWEGVIAKNGDSV
jgi:ATP-dependent DNA ligase